MQLSQCVAPQREMWWQCLLQSTAEGLLEVPDMLIKVIVLFLFVQVTVNTNIIDLNEYLQHILKSTNMKCLTPEKVSSLPVDSFVVQFFARVLFLCNLFSIC